MKNVRCVVLLALLAAVLAPLAAGAQVRITGGISGVVTDPSDAVIPGATVQLKDEGTGSTKETVTNNSGGFQFPDLNSGRYTVTVTLSGFQSAVYDKVVVEASRTTDLRIKLAVGSMGETVTVTGYTPVLETTQNTISTTIDRKQVTELPLAGRDAFLFARLVPGAVAIPGASGQTAGQSGSVMMTFNITARNVLNHPVWGTGLGALTDANITSTTFGQTTQPLNTARSFFIRTEIKF